MRPRLGAARAFARPAILVLASALAANAGAPAAAQSLPPQSAPAPGASTLPTIGHTHAKGFCDTVRENVAPTVLGLMKTDELIGASHRAISKMAHDEVASSPETMQMDRVYMDKVVAAMAHNVTMMDKLLSDSNRFPKVAHTDDDKLAQLMQAQLRAARDAQNTTLNQIYGTLETRQMSDSFNEVAGNAVSGSLTQKQGGTAWITPQGNNGGGFMGAASLAGSGPIADLRDRALTDPATTGHTLWDHLVAAVEVDQARIAHTEQVLTPTVVAAATGCQSIAPAPSPAP